ncbi:hypothetical protein EN873_32115 [bacterium M00.F.Ca.ET.230.01.1.1]|nr:hypothetical protein EN873_32115 [bacterium M00.F.Ca.ET.230.01.1.1]
MSVKVGKNHLQENLYTYTWSRDKGDRAYTGIKDQERIDKDEGYEVLYFIQTFMNKHNLKLVSDVHKIENLLHSKNLQWTSMRDQLIAGIEQLW